MNRRSFLIRTSLLALTTVVATRPSLAFDDARASQRLNARTFEALSYGAVVGDVGVEQARANAQAVEQAILDAARAGAGAVARLPKGLLLVHLDQADYVKANASYRTAAIRCAVGDITIEGAGEAETTLRAFHDGQDGYSYSVLQIGVPPLDNGNSDISGLTLRAMTLDGNYFYAKPGNYQAGRPVADSVIRVEGMRGCVFSDLGIMNAGGYAMGLQNGGYVENRFERIAIRNTMADGVDVKDNGAVSTGNVMSSISVERFGLATLPKAPFAGIDLMGRDWRLDGIRVANWGLEGTPAAGLRFKQGSSGAGRGYGAANSRAKNVKIIGEADNASSISNASNFLIGIHVKCEGVVLDGAIINGVTVGIIISQPDCVITNFDIKASTRGIVQKGRESRSQEMAGGDNLKLTAGVIRILGNSTVGVDLSRPGVVMSGVVLDVPKGRGWTMRRAFQVRESGVKYSNSTLPGQIIPKNVEP